MIHSIFLFPLQGSHNSDKISLHLPLQVQLLGLLLVQVVLQVLELVPHLDLLVKIT